MTTNYTKIEGVSLKIKEANIYRCTFDSFILVIDCLEWDLLSINIREVYTAYISIMLIRLNKKRLLYRPLH